MPSRSFAIVTLVLILASIPAFSQTVAPKGTTAASLLGNAVNALTEGVPVSGVTFSGTVTRTAGSDVETGSVTMEALGGTSGRVNLALSDGQRSQIINQSQGRPAGQWSGTDGTVHAMALHNCWTPADWFSPALALAEALNDPSVAITYVGQETRDGEAVQHIRFWRVFPPQSSKSGSAKALAKMESLSAADVYLDAAKYLPVALDFNIHPENNAAINIPVEIQYASYQQMNGILVPTHTQKLINNSPLLDIYVTSIAVNPNLSSTDFAITAARQ